MKLDLIRAFVAGTVVVGFAACGDDATPTRAEFISKGDAICKRGDARMDPLFEELFSGGGPDVEKMKRLLPKISTELKSVRNGLDELSGPADGEKAVDDIAKDLDKGIAAVDAAAASVQNDDENAGEKLFSGFDNFEKADEKARAYGFKVCGSEDDGDEGDDEKAPVDLPADQKAFVDQGDVICKKTNDELDPLFGQLFGSTDLDRRAEALEKVIAIIRRQNEALKALPAPAAIQPQMKEITDAYDANLVKAEEVRQIALSGDKAKYDVEFERLGQSFEGADDQFKRLGFEECGD